MMYGLLKYVPAIAMLSFFRLKAVALAAEKATGAGALVKKGLKDTGGAAGYESLPLPVLIGNVIQALLGVVGIIFLVLSVYAGFLWMTAGGEPGKVEKAKKMLGGALIGLVIVVAAYAFAEFVIDELVKATAGAKPL